MLQLRRQFSMALAAIAAFVSVAATAQQQPAAAPFTTQQAATGRTTYQASCAGCHVADLAGRNEAPQLAMKFSIQEESCLRRGHQQKFS